MTAVALFSCGDNTAPNGAPDASMQGETLSILDPPGESIGLTFSEGVELRVRYSGSSGSRVSFMLVADALRGEAAGGSALGATEAATDDQGVARVTLVAGAVGTNFRVEASAPRAGLATFYVTVSDEGFTELVVTPRHVGDRPVEDFDVVELRLYRTPTCATLDASAPPPSPYPPRSMDRFDEAATFSALGSNQSYSILAWGRDAEGHVLAEGCVDLAPAQVRPGQTLRLDVTVVDAPLVLDASYAVSSTFDLSSVVATVLTSSVGWRTAWCPLGTAQIVLDCALDALDAADPQDCVVEAPGVMALALEQTRGVLGADGCRGPLRPTGETSAETQLSGALSHDLGPAAPALVELLQSLSISSRLVTQAGGASAQHHLGLATLGSGTVRYDEDLVASARPIVDAVVVVSGTGAARTLDEHGFTLRLGSLTRAGMRHTILVPLSIDAEPETLGTTIVAGATAGGQTGCSAVSKAVCPGAMLFDDCLDAACAASIPSLDATLAEPVTRLGATGIDFWLRGEMVIADTDGDLAVDTLESGLWEATILLGDGAELAAAGSFSGTVE